MVYFQRDPLFTRLVNKLPNVQTDVPSQPFSSWEIAYLIPVPLKEITLEER
ncbi:MAG: hypothetical protein CM15mP129_01840 [Chloroflexota bacterium]|nr:MAG: hypothetical protein CM15mP129_01840 [Chloroflexota bacterium]